MVRKGWKWRPAHQEVSERSEKRSDPNTLWLAEEVGTNDSAKKHTIRLFEGKEVFETPKPEALVQRVLEIATNPGDLVLDSFLGSGTTAAVAHKMGRRWIGIEMGSTRSPTAPRASAR